MQPQTNFFSLQRREGRGQRLKLDADKVRLIRKRLADGVSQSVIAAEFGVKQSAISAVKSGQNWGHVDGKENG